MTRLRNSFEAQTSGTTITAANSGTATADAFDFTTTTQSGVLRYSNLHPNTGDNAGEFSGGASGNTASYVAWNTSMGTKTTIYARTYCYFEQFPTGSGTRPIRLMNGASLAATIQVGNNQRLQVYNAANTLLGSMTTLCPTNTMFRIEMKVVANASSGSVELRLFTSAEATTPTETLTFTNANTNSQFTEYQFGLCVGVANRPSFWLDNVAIDDTDWIGPASDTPQFSDGVSDPIVTTATGTLGGEIVVLTGGGSVDAMFKSSPFVRLWNMFSTSVNSGMNTVANAALMATNYLRVHAESPTTLYFGNNSKSTTTGPTFAKRMIDAGVRWVTNYRNGSYVSQGYLNEAPDLETVAPLSIALYFPGNYSTTTSSSSATASRLSGALNNSATTIRVSSARTVAPSALTQAEKNVWPFRVSRDLSQSPPTFNTSVHSSNTRDFVSWFRIDNEIIAINRTGSVTYDSATDEVVITGCVRGMWGTTAASHTDTTRVFHPVYVGSVTSGADTSLAGSPAVGDSGQTQPLRYCVAFWTALGADWIGDQIENFFLPNDANNPWQGYNAIHYDVSSSFFYNLACSFGTQVNPFDTTTNVKFTQPAWGDNQVAKFNFHGARSGWSGISLFANNHFRTNDVPIMQALKALHPGAGGTFEEFGKNGGTVVSGNTWLTEHANRVLTAMNNGEAQHYWVRFERDFSGSAVPSEVDRLKRLAYGTLLLGLDPASTDYLFGMRWNMAAPENMFYWDLGTPLESATSSIAELQYTTGATAHQSAGVWFIVQVASAAELTNATSLLNTAMDIPGVVGIGLRIPWNVINPSSGTFSDTLWNTGYNLAAAKGKKFKPRIIAGQYVPAALRGASVTNQGGQSIPVGWTDASGTPNTTFENAYEALVSHLATWAASKTPGTVPMLDMSWTSNDYSEFYYGYRDQTTGVFGGLQGAYGGNATTNEPNFQASNRRLVDKAYQFATDDLALGWGLSGAGPIVNSVEDITNYMVTKTGGVRERIVVQANGWSPNGEWGNTLEPGLDAATWGKSLLFALQDIFPSSGAGARTAADWVAMFGYAYAINATYVELYHVQAVQNPYNADLAAFNQMKSEILDFTNSRTGGGGVTTQLFVREFSNGWVIVNNSSTTAYTYPLSGNGGYVLTLDTTPGTLGSLQTSVTVPAADARIVMKPGSAEVPAAITTTATGTTLSFASGPAQQDIRPQGLGRLSPGVGSPELTLSTTSQSVDLTGSGLGPSGGVGVPIVLTASQAWFLPPVRVKYPDRKIELPSRSYRSFLRTWEGGEDLEVGGITYLNGRWNGPLTQAEIVALTTEGYGARIIYKDEEDPFPVIDS